MITEADKYLAQFLCLEDAKAHARACYPEESCGLIVNGRYLPAVNQAADPATHVKGDPDCKCRLCAFAISDADYLAYANEIEAIVHSHPGGPAYPSKLDMAQQDATGVAWIILTLDETRFGPVTVWGGDCPREPLIGREFIHGVSDCYSLIRDVFALGKEGMAAQGMEWPLDPIQLPLAPRRDNWWEDGTEDLYETEHSKAGFVQIDRFDVRPGDVFLGAIRSPRLNHGGVLLGKNLILHHLPQRLSRREPAGIWSRTAEKWVRYVGATNA